MFTPIDFLPAHTSTPGRSVRPIVTVGGILLAPLVWAAIRAAGSLAALAILYVIGLAIILRALIAPTSA